MTSTASNKVTPLSPGPWASLDPADRKKAYYYHHIQCAMTGEDFCEMYQVSLDDFRRWVLANELQYFHYSKIASIEQRQQQSFVADRASRTSRNRMFMDIAQVVAQRSTCLTCKVGAVVTVDHRVVATGYNGAPCGKYHCTDVGICKKEMFGAAHFDSSIPGQLGAAYELSRSVHAEQSCLTQAARAGIALDGGEIFVTREPCVICMRMLINCGISRVFFLDAGGEDICGVDPRSTLI